VNDTDLADFTSAVFVVLERVLDLVLCGETNAAVGNAFATLAAAGMQLTIAAVRLISASLPGKEPSGQQGAPNASLTDLVGSVSSTMLVLCAVCIKRPHPDVVGSPVYLDWSSISAVVLSYASLLRNSESLPNLSTNSTSSSGSDSDSTTLPQTGSSPGGNSCGSCGGNSSRKDSSSQQAASQSSSSTPQVSGIAETWPAAALAAWGRASQQLQALPASHVELLAMLGISKEVALWVAACWATKAGSTLPFLHDFIAVHPCVQDTAVTATWLQSCKG
jgi:hypothetical protein